MNGPPLYVPRGESVLSQRVLPNLNRTLGNLLAQFDRVEGLVRGQAAQDRELGAQHVPFCTIAMTAWRPARTVFHGLRQVERVMAIASSALFRPRLDSSAAAGTADSIAYVSMVMSAMAPNDFLLI